MTTYQTKPRHTKAVVFLHGVFFDHTMWLEVASEVKGVDLVFIDMPVHGSSQDIRESWTFDDSCQAIERIIETLTAREVIIVGHSWGGMTAATIAPSVNKITKVVTFNMPVFSARGLRRLGFIIQKSLSFVPKLYARTAALSLFAKRSIQNNRSLAQHLEKCMRLMKPQQMRRTVSEVIIKKHDLVKAINKNNHIIMFTAREDYTLHHYDKLPSDTLPGGHVSPLEYPSIAASKINEVYLKYDPKDKPKEYRTYKTNNKWQYTKMA